VPAAAGRARVNDPKETQKSLLYALFKTAIPLYAKTLIIKTLEKH